jgi:hypothetical protein
MIRAAASCTSAATRSSESWSSLGPPRAPDELPLDTRTLTLLASGRPFAPLRSHRRIAPARREIDRQLASWARAWLDWSALRPSGAVVSAVPAQAYASSRARVSPRDHERESDGLAPGLDGRLQAVAASHASIGHASREVPLRGDCPHVDHVHAAKPGRPGRWSQMPRRASTHRTVLASVLMSLQTVQLAM